MKKIHMVSESGLAWRCDEWFVPTTRIVFKWKYVTCKKCLKEKKGSTKEGL